MAPIFHYVLLRGMREQGAREGKRRDQKNTMDSGGKRVRIRGDRIAAVAETEVQPPDHPQTDHSMEHVFMNALKGVMFHNNHLQSPLRTRLPVVIITVGTAMP